MLVPVAAAALIDRDGRIIVAQRTLGEFAGLWEFPGGKIEADETPEAALVRELREELGIAVDKIALQPLTFTSHPIDGGHVLLLLYAVRRWIGEPQGLQGQPVRRVAVGELAALAMPPADVPLVAALTAFMERKEPA